MTVDPGDIERLLELAERRPANYAYVFDHLNSSQWLGPLAERGVFSDPPAPVTSNEGVWFPEWPPAMYLARVAGLSEAQEKVVALIRTIPVNSNVRVHARLLGALLRCPPRVAAGAVPTVLAWLGTEYRPLDAVKFAKLAAALAEGGEHRAGLRIASRLVAACPGALHGKAPTAWFLNDWEYEQSLTTMVPTLTKAAPRQTIRMLCQALEEELASDGAFLDEVESALGVAEDLSHVWRPAIEEHEQNRDHDDVRNSLVSALRDAAHGAASTDPESTIWLVQTLEERGRRVFHRLSLDLLRASAAIASSHVAARLTSRSLFDDAGMLHEYYHLLHDCFGLLSTDDQAVILGWIDEGPDKEEYVAWFKEREGNPPSGDQLSDYCDFWRVKKLMPVSESLPEEWKQRFDGLVARLGLPEHPDFPVYHGTWLGPTSPLKVEDIRTMEPVKLIAHLRDWVPPQEWDAPTPEGLGRLVAAAVADDPSRYVPVLDSLAGIEATYVRSFLEGLRQANETKKPFEWGPVLDLATRVVHSPWPTPRPSGPVHDRDSDWGSTRKTIAAVIEAGLGSGVSEIPISFRETVWQVLEPLADDPDPTPEDEDRHGEGGFDAVTMSINTVRGRAMHAIVQYGLWVMRHAPGSRGQEGEREPDGATVPEMWLVLDRHLDVAQDLSLAVRSVYGQWFPWIHLLGRNWAVSHVDEIFPRDPEHAPWWTAAWIGYLMYTRPFDDVLPALRPVYEHAVKLLGPNEKPLMFGDRPSERLGEHLVTYAWRGKIAVDPVDPLLEEYWTKADVNLRQNVLSHIGRSLREWPPAALDPGIPSAVERLKIFWASAASHAGRPDDGDQAGELSAFAWWFDSGQFDDEWAFEQLDLVLRKTSVLDEAHLVAKRLVETVEREPLRSVRVLNALVQSDREGWRIIGWKDETREVLEKAMESDDPETRRACIALANRLVAKGHLEFRELVDTHTGQGGHDQGV
jgi:hypothetical protein